MIEYEQTFFCLWGGEKLTSGDNTIGMKYARAYKRIIAAILEKQPNWIIERMIYELCPPGDTLKTFDEKVKELTNQAVLDSANYTMHYQGGKCVPILKDSLIAKKLFKESLMPKKKKNEEE